MRPMRSISINNCGWGETKKTKKCIDGEGNPIPWYTYSSIFFLESRLYSSFNVFEFGCGYSTLWWANRVNHVTSVEHDLNWYNEVKTKMPSNATVMHKPKGQEYFDYIDSLGVKFDIIVIDGYASDRYKSTQPSLRNILKGGIVILDNSDADYAKSNYDGLLDAGFKAIDFTGLGPINNCFWCTSIFYQQDNIFGI